MNPTGFPCSQVEPILKIKVKVSFLRSLFTKMVLWVGKCITGTHICSLQKLFHYEPHLALYKKLFHYEPHLTRLIHPNILSSLNFEHQISIYQLRQEDGEKSNVKTENAIYVIKELVKNIIISESVALFRKHYIPYYYTVCSSKSWLSGLLSCCKYPVSTQIS